MTIAPEARTCAAELNVKDLAIGHNGKTLLKHLTFSVPAGSSLAIVGESGCGKSTLLTTLAGLLPALGGELSWRDAQGSVLKHPNSSFVWQQLGLLPWKTVQKNLTLPLLLSQHKIPAADCADRAAAMIEELGLSGLENRWPATLSGGQRQRLALGRALIAQPAVLFMDEPFSALDALRRERLQDFLAGMRRRRPTTMIFVTHDIGEAAFLASDILLLFRSGPPHSMPAIRTFAPRNDSICAPRCEKRCGHPYRAAIPGRRADHRQERIIARQIFARCKIRGTARRTTAAQSFAPFPTAATDRTAASPESRPASRLQLRSPP